MFASGPAVKCWGSSWRREVPAVRGSSRWPQASVSPSWGWTNTPLYSKSWRGTWRSVSRHVTEPLFESTRLITSSRLSAGESPWPTRYPQVHGLLQKPVGKRASQLLTSGVLRQNELMRGLWTALCLLPRPGPVSGGEEAQGAGAADPHRVHPAVGGGRHQDPGLRPLHEPGAGPESWLRGIGLTHSSAVSQGRRKGIRGVGCKNVLECRNHKCVFLSLLLMHFQLFFKWYPIENIWSANKKWKKHSLTQTESKKAAKYAQPARVIQCCR